MGPWDLEAKGRGTLGQSEDGSMESGGCCRLGGLALPMYSDSRQTLPSPLGCSVRITVERIFQDLSSQVWGMVSPQQDHIFICGSGCVAVRTQQPRADRAEQCLESRQLTPGA